LLKIEKLKESILKSQNIALISHLNADPDAISSMISLKSLIRSLKKGIRILQVTPEGMSEVSKRMVPTFKESFQTQLDMNKIDMVVLVDTSSPILLGELQDEFNAFNGQVIIIDHHNPSIHLPKESLRFIDENACSTCEVVLDLYNRLRVKPSRRIAKALLAGIAYDTGHFTFGGLRTFEAVVQLIRLGAKAEESVSMLRFRIERSEKIARLKAASRCRIFEANGWIITLSQVNSYQASAARSLVAVGADLAVVYGVCNGELRINLRSVKVFGEGYAHLGRDIAAPLGETLGGSGGGHDAAAGINVQRWKGEPSIVFKALAKVLKTLAKPLTIKELK
jgi:nanoRNase/pAp phosphatase (c-di-AMP/oligoRNAs hydrolase)